MDKLFFPLFVDLSKKRIVIIGGGNIALRRAETLMDFCENICVVSPVFLDGFLKMEKEGKLTCIHHEYTKTEIEGADIVLAATDDVWCNEQVVSDCRKRHICVNAAHKKELCDFYFPGIARAGHMTAGISASGCDHKEVSNMRKEIQKVMDDIYEGDRREHGAKKDSDWKPGEQACSDTDRTCN